MIHVVRREVAATDPLGEAVVCSIIFSARDTMLRVVEYGPPTWLHDDATRRRSTMPRLNIGHGDHVAIDAIASLLEGEDPVPAVK